MVGRNNSCIFYIGTHVIPSNIMQEQFRSNLISVFNQINSCKSWISYCIYASLYLSSVCTLLYIEPEYGLHRKWQRFNTKLSRVNSYENCKHSDKCRFLVSTFLNGLNHDKTHLDLFWCAVFYVSISTYVNWFIEWIRFQMHCVSVTVVKRDKYCKENCNLFSLR